MPILPPCDHDECGPTHCGKEGGCAAADGSALYSLLMANWGPHAPRFETLSEYEKLRIETAATKFIRLRRITVTGDMVANAIGALSTRFDCDGIAARLTNALNP